MTIQCLSNESILYTLGEWSVAELEYNRDNYLFSAVDADICSKVQRVYIYELGAKNTKYLDWNCAYCNDTISINATTKKPHWKKFLCGSCQSIGFKKPILRSVVDFNKSIQSIIKSNLDVDSLI
jgi:hypothetical protein